jgi:hypothetical protein
MVAVALTVSNSSSLPPIIPSNSFAASLSASGNAGAIINRHHVASDSLYRQVCRESAHKWREAHPGYWKQYRQNHPQQVERNRQRQQRRDQKRRLLNLANNNLAVDLKRSAAEVWLLGPTARHLANDNLATCQLLIFQSPVQPVVTPPASCQQHPSGAAPLAGL